MFSSDKPITQSNDDRLNRKSFAKHLAQAIIGYTSQENFTIGLCGKWGSGKTSIINMVVEEIEAMAENKPIVIKFNPWNYSDKSQLMDQFFHTLLLEIGAKSSSKALQKIGFAMQKYAELLTYAKDVPGVGVFAGPTKWLLKSAGSSMVGLAKSKETLDGLKDQITKALREQSQKIIVIIDDIDRLNNEQIRLIFQLVNCVAGFPNMVYLLSFDRSVVVRALEDEQKCNGEEYLEKIIQVPFEVPEAKSDDINQILFDQLDNLWFEEKTPTHNFDKDYWNNVFFYCISPFLHTIRDVNRVMSVYKFKYGLLHSETNCVDLLAITTLQVCAPKIYDWIKDNISQLVGSSYGASTTGVNQKKSKEDYLKVFEMISGDGEQMLNALQSLFPKFSWKTGGVGFVGGTDSELRYKQRIACADRTPLYFRLSLEDVGIPRELIVDSINTLSSDDWDQMINELIEKKLISLFAKELIAQSNNIPDDRKQLLIQKLVDLQTKELEDEEKGFFHVSPGFYCAQCCWTILKTMSTENAFTVTRNLIDVSNDDQFDVLTDMVVNIERSYGRIGNSPDQEYRVVTKEQLLKLEELIFARTLKMTQELYILKMKKPWGKYRIWKLKDSESLQKHIREGLRDKRNIPSCIAACAVIWTGGKTQGWEFKKETIEEIIPLDKAYEGIVSIKNTEDFSNLSHEVKEATVAFYLWYNSDRNEHDSLYKERIDSIIPEWEK